MQFLLESMQFEPLRNNSRPRDLTQHQFIEIAKAEPVMGRITDSTETIDYRTSRSICDAVGERLQQNLRPEAELSQPLRRLIDQLRRHDGELH